MGKRMFYVFKIIQDSKDKSISAKEIVKKLEAYEVYVDIKTIYTCVKNINEFFKEWVHGDMISSKRKSGFMMNYDFFDDGELQFLLDSIAFHQDLRYEDKNTLRKRLLLLSSAHQKSRLIDFKPMQKDLSFSLFLNLSTIMKAIENQSVLSFQYINYEVKHNHLQEVPSQNGNHKEEYLISPYQIVSTNNHYYLIAYNDKYKNQLTTYRIDRMRLIKTTRYRFIEMREQFDMRDEIDKTTNMYIESSRDTLQLECDKKLLREVASHFGHDLRVERLYQDHYLITIEDIPISEGLIGWIMMLQSQIKVIAPQSLQDEIKVRIQKLMKLYENELNAF